MPFPLTKGNGVFTWETLNTSGQLAPKLKGGINLYHLGLIKKIKPFLMPSKAKEAQRLRGSFMPHVTVLFHAPSRLISHDCP